LQRFWPDPKPWNHGAGGRQSVICSTENLVGKTLGYVRGRYHLFAGFCVDKVAFDPLKISVDSVHPGSIHASFFLLKIQVSEVERHLVVVQFLGSTN